MTPQQIVGLSVRLFAIWLVFEALQMVGNGMGFNNQPGLEPTSAFFIWSAVMFLLAIALWFFPMVVAHAIIPRTKFNDVLCVPASAAITIACVIFGLWLLSLRVVPALAYYLSLVVALKANNQSLLGSGEFTLVRLGAVVIELSVAATLCFKAHIIARHLTSERMSEEEGGRAL